MLIKLNKKAQAIPEYAILIGIMVMAFVGMQTYFKRGVQAFVKNAVDEIGYQRDSVRGEPNDPERRRAIDAATPLTTGTTTTNGTNTSAQVSGGGIQIQRTYNNSVVTVNSSASMVYIPRAE